jgi:hypothetical protein
MNDALILVGRLILFSPFLICIAMMAHAACGGFSEDEEL